MEQMETSFTSFQPIAIVGVGALYPASRNATEFWRNIVEGRDLITEVPKGHWLIQDYYDPDPKARDKTYCKRGAFLPNFEFDPMEYGVPPANLSAIDTSQLLALLAAKEVLGKEEAHRFHQVDLSRISVILGAAVLEAIQYAAGRMQRPAWLKSMIEYGIAPDEAAKICDRIADHFTEWQENTFPGLLSNVVAGRVANRFNLGGTNCIVDAACAGSLAALSMAVNELQTGMVDMTITGGVDTLNDIVMYMCFSKTQALSFSGDCRPFSSEADGTVIGEGIGMLALKRLADAERDGNPIYAIIKGIGTASDGRSKSIYAPVPEGQQRAIERAYATAGFEPETIGLIEAHGTGTKAGDTAELKGLSLAFQNTTKKQFCALGSIKSQIGHTKSAAGAAGLFKAIMSLHHKTLPPTLKVNQPNDSIDWAASPFYLNTTLRPWYRRASTPRRAAVSSFGFGGSNFHVALEEYQGTRPALRLRTQASELILLSSEGPAELLALCEETLASTRADFSLSYFAYQSQRTASASDLCRLSLITDSTADFCQKLQMVINALKTAEGPPHFPTADIYYGHALDPGKVAFLFPGQGSQYLGMGKDLCLAYEEALQPWDDANEVPFAHQYLSDIVCPPGRFNELQKQNDIDTLIDTISAQPALAVASISQLKMLQGLQIYPDCVSGHSFGELTALYAASVIDEEQLVKMARARGECMQSVAGPDGAMLCVLHPVTEVQALLKKWQSPLTLANFNSPKQLVLSGRLEDIIACEQQLKAEQINYRRLKVKTAFHSPLVTDACQSFAAFLSPLSFNKPKIPVYSNMTAELYPSGAIEIKHYLTKQLVSPVLFEQQINAMYESGVRTFIEVGPQGTLTQLVKQSLEKNPHYAVQLDRKGTSGVISLLQAIGQLFTIGLNPHCEFLWKNYALPEKIQSSAKPQFTVMLNGTNYGKPYPRALDTPVPIKPINQAPPIQPIKPKIINPSLREQKTMSETTEPGVIQMVQELQKQLVDAHNTYQKSMAESHIAFLNSVSQLAGHFVSPNENRLLSPSKPMSVQPTKGLTVSAPVDAPSMPHMAAAVSAPAPVFPVKPVIMAPAVPPPVMATETPVFKPTVQSAPPLPIQQPMVSAPSMTPRLATSFSQLKDILLKIVVDKTGYPAEMLNMEMSIEADLGIDSIKRIEILSALTETVPNLPEVNPTKIAELRTLGDIVNYMEQQLAALQPTTALAVDN